MISYRSLRWLRLPVLVSCLFIVGMSFAFAGGSKEKSTASTAPQTITLKFPHWFFVGGAFADWINGAVDQFEKQNPNVHVDRISVPYAGYWDKLETQVGAGNPPDIAGFGPGPFAQFVAAGRLLPLNNLINMSDVEANYSTLQTKDIPAVAPDGKTYLLATDTGFYLPEYLPSVFKSAGISSYATTPNAFVSMVKKLTTSSRSGYAYADIAGDYSEEFIDIAIWAIGMGGYWADSSGKPTLNSPAVIDAVTYLKKLYDAGVTPRDTPKGTYRKEFALGKVATIMDGMWMYGLSVGWNPSTKSDFAVANLPFPTQRVASFYEGVGILKGTKYPKEAAKLIETLSNPLQSRRLVELSQFIPPRIAIFTPEFKASLVKKWPWYKVFLDHANSQDMILDVPSNMPGDIQVKVQKILGTYFDKVLFENMNPTQAMNAAQKQALGLYN